MNFIGHIKLSGYNFKTLLQEFNLHFQAKQYKSRIPYDDWRLYRFIGDNGLVNITYDEDEEEIQVSIPDVIDRVYCVFDDGFGEFLFSRYKGTFDSCRLGDNSLLNITPTAQNITISGERVEDTTIKIENKKENKMKGLNFDFGPCTGDNVRLSMYGIAIKNAAGAWVSYNKGDIVDVDVFNFEGGKFLFKMPVAINDIAVGDIVVHNKVPMFVTGVENGIEVVDIRAGEKKSIIPTKNMFGFDFVTKIVSMFNAVGNGPTADQPFGNMLPFLMMEEGGDIDPMMMMLMMNSGKGSFDMSNPMMMYFLMGDKTGSSKDMLPLMMMMGLGGAKC